MEDSTTPEKVVGITSLTAGGLTLIASITTLIAIYMKRSFRFIRNMVWVMIITSMVQMFQGVLFITFANPTQWTNLSP